MPPTQGALPTMNTRDRILTDLRTATDWITGEQLAERLGISRMAVNKQIATLNEMGYVIESAHRKGYLFHSAPDLLLPEEVRFQLQTHTFGQGGIHYFQETESTNSRAKEAALSGCPEGALFVAEHQTAGRGRRGRNWFSAPQHGLCMTLVLRPPFAPPGLSLLPLLTAVAVSEAVEEASGLRAEVKWPNDLLIGGKKICGILTEASISLENGFIDYVVLGVGVNVCAPQNGFPNELENTAGAIFSSSKDDIKNRLTAEFLNRFMEYSGDAKRANYAAEYKKRSFVLGRKVLVLRNGNSTGATALDIDESCHLLVRYDDGTTEYLSSGEISVKLGAE